MKRYKKEALTILSPVQGYKINLSNGDISALTKLKKSLFSKNWIVRTVWYREDVRFFKELDVDSLNRGFQGSRIVDLCRRNSSLDSYSDY